MSFKKVPADNANKIVQFEVKENADSLSFKFDAAVADADVSATNVRVELLVKNKPNQVLLDTTLSNLKSVLKTFYPDLKNLIPLSFGKSLVLNDNAYLLVTFKWVHATPVNDFQYAINQSVGKTYVPLIIKKVNVQGVQEIDSEFYPILMLPATVNSYETVVMSESANGVLEPTKVQIHGSQIASILQAGHTYTPIVLQKDQKITVDAVNTDIYLLQVS